jgi:hypothetical protein
MRDMAELNEYLRECCVRDRDRNSSGKSETIGVRFEQDRKASASLPKYRFDTSFRRDAKVDKYQPSRTVCSGWTPGGMVRPFCAKHALKQSARGGSV